MKKGVKVCGLIAALFALSACSATPDKPSDSQPGVVYDKPISQVQQAAIAALTANGFDVGKSEPAYVEGSRPHKMGALVGSGGETAGIWLTALDDKRTSVKVDTAKSLVGMAGQKSWNAEIFAELDKSVGPRE